MSVVCPQCGTPAKGTDKFCNSCGFLLQQPGQAPPPQPFGGPPQGPPPQQGPYGYGAPMPDQGQGGFPPPQQQFGPPPQNFGPPPQQQFAPQGPPAFQQQPPPQQYAPPPYQQQQPPPYGAPPAPYGAAPQAVCAQGHEIPPGASYCPMGHPIAVQGPPHDAYQGGGFAPPQQQQPPPPFGAPPPFGQAPAPPAQAPFGGGAAPMAPTETPPPVAVQPSAQAVRGFLISYQTNNNGDFWPLKGGRVVIGRAQSVDGLDIQLPDATISSRHATLHVDGIAGTVAVEDTGSTNGTYVNEEHIGLNGKRDLHDGDKVRFGGYTTIVKIVTRV